MRGLILLGAAALAALPLAFAGGALALETPEGLPDLPGRDETFGYCIGCHSFQVVGRQGMSRERWDETLSWMTTRHSMPAPDAETRKVLLDYLSAAFPAQQARRAAGSTRSRRRDGEARPAAPSLPPVFAYRPLVPPSGRRHATLLDDIPARPPTA